MDINSAKILICDDSEMARKQLKDVIAFFGNPVVLEAEDGEAAVAIFEKEKPDLVFLDIIMPKLSGKDALREILLMDENARVVIVSSVGNRDMLLETVKMGAREFIQKPFSELQIISALTKNLASE